VDGRGSQAGYGERRKPNAISPYQHVETINRRAVGEALDSIAKSYAVDFSMISRLLTPAGRRGGRCRTRAAA
jgi:hypothetical protein